MARVVRVHSAGLMLRSLLPLGLALGAMGAALQRNTDALLVADFPGPQEIGAAQAVIGSWLVAIEGPMSLDDTRRTLDELCRFIRLVEAHGVEYVASALEPLARPRAIHVEPEVDPPQGPAGNAIADSIDAAPRALHSAAQETEWRGDGCDTLPQDKPTVRKTKSRRARAPDQTEEEDSDYDGRGGSDPRPRSKQKPKSKPRPSRKRKRNGSASAEEPGASTDQVETSLAHQGEDADFELIGYSTHRRSGRNRPRVSYTGMLEPPTPYTLPGYGEDADEECTEEPDPPLVKPEPEHWQPSVPYAPSDELEIVDRPAASSPAPALDLLSQKQSDTAATPADVYEIIEGECCCCRTASHQQYRQPRVIIPNSYTAIPLSPPTEIDEAALGHNFGYRLFDWLAVAVRLAEVHMKKCFDQDASLSTAGLVWRAVQLLGRSSDKKVHLRIVELKSSKGQQLSKALEALKLTLLGKRQRMYLYYLYSPVPAPRKDSPVRDLVLCAIRHLLLMVRRAPLWDAIRAESSKSTQNLRHKDSPDTGLRLVVPLYDLPLRGILNSYLKHGQSSILAGPVLTAFGALGVCSDASQSPETALLDAIFLAHGATYSVYLHPVDSRLFPKIVEDIVGSDSGHRFNMFAETALILIFQHMLLQWKTVYRTETFANNFESHLNNFVEKHIRTVGPSSPHSRARGTSTAGAGSATLTSSTNNDDQGEDSNAVGPAYSHDDEESFGASLSNDGSQREKKKTRRREKSVADDE